jgi:hypothetical protein
MSEEKKTFSIVYESRKDKPVIAVTGAVGGSNSNTDTVVAHLYVEYASVPAISTHPVIDEKAVDMSAESADEIKRGNITRDILATLVLSPANAVTIGEWLANHGRALLEIKND